MSLLPCTMPALRTVGKLALAVSLWLQSCSGLPANGVRLDNRAPGFLESFIASESPIALQGVLDNIGDTGSKAPGARPGITIASPSTSNPNCMLLIPRRLILTFPAIYFLNLPDDRCCGLEVFTP